MRCNKISVTKLTLSFKARREYSSPNCWTSYTLAFNSPSVFAHFRAFTLIPMYFQVLCDPPGFWPNRLLLMNNNKITHTEMAGTDYISPALSWWYHLNKIKYIKLKRKMYIHVMESQKEKGVWGWSSGEIEREIIICPVVSNSKVVNNCLGLFVWYENDWNWKSEDFSLLL